MSRVSNADAETIRRQIMTAFKYAVTPGNEPVIVRDWVDDGDCAIVWECGPFEWTLIYSELEYGDTVDREFGFKLDGTPVVSLPNVIVSPYHGHAVTLHTENWE